MMSALDVFFCRREYVLPSETLSRAAVSDASSLNLYHQDRTSLSEIVWLIALRMMALRGRVVALEQFEQLGREL